MTPQVGEIWQARVMGYNYLLLEKIIEGFAFVLNREFLFKTLRLDTGVIELWVVTEEHYRRVA
jgi:hypothetical protein